LLTAPRGLAVADGLALRGRSRFDRVVAFKESDGSFVGDSREVPAGDRDRPGGEVYRLARRPAPDLDLIKFSGLKEGKELYRAGSAATGRARTSGNTGIAWTPRRSRSALVPSLYAHPNKLHLHRGHRHEVREPRRPADQTDGRRPRAT